MISSKNFLQYIFAKLKGHVDRHHSGLPSDVPVKNFRFEQTLRETMSRLEEGNAD